MESQLGALLQKYRAGAGLTQEALAQISGISVQAISAIERGARRYPQRPTLAALATALKLDEARHETLVAAAKRPPRLAPGERPQRGRGSLTPRLLPRDVPDFTGRIDEVAAVAGWLTNTTTATTGSPIVAITGMAGVGKTALAVHVAHLVSSYYPDGQLYADMRGADPEHPQTPIDVLRTFMDLLGASMDIADDLDTAAARFHSMVVTRRLLIVLDNAGSANEVAALLPASPGSAAIITSRRALTSLIDAKKLHLDVLPISDAVHLLSAIVGQERITRGATESRELLSYCGRLPLAIRLAGAWLLTRPQAEISQLTRRLKDERQRLNELSVDNQGVAANLAVSLLQLADSTDRIDIAAGNAFVVLGLTNFRHLSARIAAPLLDVPEHEACSILDRLVDVNLLIGVTAEHYRMHDLVRAFALEQADERPAAHEQNDALTRLYRRIAAVGWRMTEPSRRRPAVRRDTKC